MKILYDYQIFTTQKYGGISRNFVEILKANRSKVGIILSKNFYLKNTKIKHLYFNFSFKGHIRFMTIINKLFSIFYLIKSDYDVFHPTYYNPFFLKYLKDKPFVLTIHDMTHEIYPDIFHSRDNTTLNKEKLAQKATRIIAVSENTKKDIINILNISEDKIDVIYHGESMQFVDECKVFSNKLKNNFILFTGLRTYYKNFENLILAISPILNKNKNLYLYCAGGGEFSGQEIKLLKELKVNKQIIQHSCNDSELKSLYLNAMFFVYPSTYEGFGIPLLEAMSCNLPILCSDNSCFPEIAKDSAIYFDPFNIQDIRQKIKFALSNNLDNYKISGSARVQYFSWDKTREEIYDVYKKSLKNR